MSTFGTTDHDVVVIDAGQAGLAIGHHLQPLGLGFVILDGAARLGDTWRSRWDSLVLFTPAQYDGLPGMPFPAEPDTYPGKDQVAAYLETHAAAAMRRVDLAVGQRPPSFPQRRAGRDLFWWLTATGAMRATADSRLGRRLRARDAVIGTGPRQLRRLGVRLRPRVTAAEGHAVRFADGSHLDDVAAVIWATGFRLDHSWIHVPKATDDAGGVVQRRGITPAPGLYTLGLPWQHTRGSGLLGFVADDAAYLAARIAERHDARAGRTTPSLMG